MIAVVSLGSNLGDRLAHLSAAIEVISQELPVSRVSAVFQTEPVGGVAQEEFLNVVAIAEVRDPWQALAACHRAEDARGRLRQVRWGPRTLDADVVTVGSIRLQDPRLTLPHPRAHERSFVLAPWQDVDPDAEVVGRGRVVDLLESAIGGVRRLDEPLRWSR